MGIALRAFWAALKDYYEELFTLLGANLLWAVALAAPLIGLSLLSTNILGAILIIPVLALPPATAGVFYLANQVAHHKTVELGMFFQGFRTYLVKSWLLALLNLGVLAVFWTNLQFYGHYEAQWAVVVKGLFVGLFAFWNLIQLYVLPMLMEQQEPRLLLALRNAAFLTLASPITSLVLGILVLIVIALSVGLALPFVCAMMAVIGLVGNEAVLTLLVHFGIRKKPEEVEA